MDKETLSNYGWIVIAVLVLAVMIALASPFGHFIENGVKSTAQGLFDVNQSAGAIAGLDIPDQEFEGSNGGGSTPSTPNKDPALNPDDGTTPQYGDTYEQGDYIYTYYTSINGWKVTINTAVTDKNQTTYGAILESINGEPVTNMDSTFSGCTALETAPAIPSSVTNMGSTFNGCTSLVTAPEIPSSVTDMEGTFIGCTSLIDLSDFIIPNSVTSLEATFRGCTSLVTAPVIPNSVTNMMTTFNGCTSLVTAPAIPSSVTNMTETFSNCTSLTDEISIPCSLTNKNYTYANCPATITYYHVDGCEGSCGQ